MRLLYDFSFEFLLFFFYAHTPIPAIPAIPAILNHPWLEVGFVLRFYRLTLGHIHLYSLIFTHIRSYVAARKEVFGIIAYGEKGLVQLIAWWAM